MWTSENEWEKARNIYEEIIAKSSSQEKTY